MNPSIALVGSGRWGRYILRDLKSLGARVTAVTTSGEGRAFAAQYGADAVVDRIDLLPAHFDGYVVATPTATHAAVIRQLLPRERPIYVEKPITNDLADARELVQRAAGSIFVMDKWRYHPGVAALRDLARGNTLGRLLSIHTVRVGWANPHSDVDAIWILLPHDLSIVLEILGTLPEPRFALAERGQREAAGLLAALGGPGHVDVVCEVSCRRLVKQRLITVNFERGTAALEEGLADHISIRRLAGGDPRQSDPTENLPISTELPLLLELQAFLGYLAGGPPPKSSASDGLRIVETVARLRELAQA